MACSNGTSLLLLVALAVAGSLAVDVPLSELDRSQIRRIPRPRNPPSGDHLAYQFRGQAPVCLRSPLITNAASVLQSACNGGCFTLSASVRLETQVPGTLVSIVFPQSKFEITFRYNTEVRIRYTGPGQYAYHHHLVYKFNLHQWYDVGVTICPTLRRIVFYVNCNQIYSEALQTEVMCSADGAHQGKICFGGSGITRARFQGSVQNLRMSSGDFPTGCDRSNCASPRAILEEQVSVMQKSMKILRSQHDTCQAARMQCKWNGATYAHNATWSHNCTVCTCRNETVVCAEKSCRAVNCPQRNMVMEQLAGRCCPVCRFKRANEISTSCKYHGHYYYNTAKMPRHVDDVYNCAPCVCTNRIRVCTRRSCPTLTCPEAQQHTATGQCCGVCLNHDVCRTTAPCGDVRYSKCTNKPNGGYACGQYCKNSGYKNPHSGMCEAPRAEPQIPDAWKDLFDIFG